MKDIPEITGMRGYASQAVVVFHLLLINNFLSWLGASRIVFAWNSGVDFFFVLSGFLLTVPFIEASRTNRRTSLKEFYIKRAFRILPVYYLSLFLAVVIFSRPATATQIVSSIFFMQSFSMSTFNSINGVSWTLVIEEIFYATLPLFSLFFLKRRWIYSLPACFAISLVYRNFVYAIYHQNSVTLHFFMWQYPAFLATYAVGCTLANLYVARGEVPVRPTNGFLNSVPMLSSIAILLATEYWYGSTLAEFNDIHVFPALVFAIEYGALIYFTLTSPATTVLRSIFTNRLAIFSGRISYSVYSIHLPILDSLAQLRLPLISWIYLSYVMILLTATAIYYVVERPSLELRRLVIRKMNERKRKEEPILSVRKR